MLPSKEQNDHDAKTKIKHKTLTKSQTLSHLPKPYSVPDMASYAWLSSQPCNTSITILQVVTLRLKHLNTTFPPQGRKEREKGERRGKKGRKDRRREKRKRKKPQR